MVYSDPKYPIVNPSPSVDDCVGALRISDYFAAAGVTAGSWGYGYIFGKPVRMPTASTAAAIGFTFATFMVLQDTRARLMGYKENAKEIKKYGLHSEQVPKRPVQDPRFPTVASNISPVRPEVHFKNYN